MNEGEPEYVAVGLGEFVDGVRVDGVVERVEVAERDSVDTVTVAVDRVIDAVAVKLGVCVGDMVAVV